MTREEAIGMIRNDIKLHHDYLSGRYRQALNMAIGALKQPEIVRCKDCIHFNFDNKPEEGCGFCELLSRTYQSDHYCADEEKR